MHQLDAVYYIIVIKGKTKIILQLLELKSTHWSKSERDFESHSDYMRG